MIEESKRDTTQDTEDNNQTIPTCKGPNCGCPISPDDKTFSLCYKCPHCNYESCIHCAKESHAPCTCEEIKLWNQYTNPDAMEKHLYGPNLKKCPLCGAKVEKKEGSYYTKCKKCNEAFCWMCLKNWKDHPNTYFQCKNYDPATDPYIPKDNVSLALISIYYDVFKKYAKKFEDYRADNELERRILDRINDSTHDEVSKTVAKFKDQVTWACNTVSWGYAKLFLLAYEIVKELPVDQQLPTVQNFDFQDEKHRDYLREEYYVENMKNTLDECMRIIEELEKQESNALIDFSRLKRDLSRLSVSRFELLSHNDCINE